MQEKTPQNLITPLVLQQLADLGYRKDIRSSLKEEEIQKIIKDNITFESFQKKKEEEEIERIRQEKSAKVPAEIKIAYKEAYDKFVAREEGFKEFALESEIQRFNEIVRICGSGSVDDVRNYLFLHDLELSDEEKEFLEKTIVYKSFF